MTRDLSSEETTVVATYLARHDAEMARSFLADQGIDSFVIADDVHVPLQLTQGARLLVMRSQAQKAYDALVDANMMGGSVQSDAYSDDVDEVDEEEDEASN
jgi:hypothetical protein